MSGRKCRRRRHEKRAKVAKERRIAAYKAEVKIRKARARQEQKPKPIEIGTEVLMIPSGQTAVVNSFHVDGGVVVFVPGQQNHTIYLDPDKVVPA